jgi:hypothetical protein
MDNSLVGWIVIKDDYFMAVQAGLDNDEPMKAVFRQVLLDTQRDFA